MLWTRSLILQHILPVFMLLTSLIIILPCLLFMLLLMRSLLSIKPSWLYMKGLPQLHCLRSLTILLNPKIPNALVSMPFFSVNYISPVRAIVVQLFVFPSALKASVRVPKKLAFCQIVVPSWIIYLFLVAIFSFISCPHMFQFFCLVSRIKFLFFLLVSWN